MIALVTDPDNNRNSPFRSLLGSDDQNNSQDERGQSAREQWRLAAGGNVKQRHR